MNTTSQNHQGLFHKLLQYSQSDAYPFHMPGHKRNLPLIREMLSEDADLLPYQIDITEIHDFDNLHHAKGVLARAQDLAASLYHAEKTFYLINGSTCGLLAAIFSCTTQNGCLLAARNCHKAVYHAAELRQLELIYLYPEQEPDGINGVIRPEDVETELSAHPEIQAVLLTSPTYDGVVSDIRAIAGICHRHKRPLIVDEAHGAHFGFHPYFPESALSCGADLVIHSMHKTLPSLTQTALLHISSKESLSFISEERIRKYLGMFETSSPSYVFMAGMDQCIRLLLSRGEELFETFARNLQWIRSGIGALQHIHLLSAPKGIMDPSKLVIRADGYTGHELSGLLRETFHLEMEMEASGYVLALTTLADTREGFARLLTALQEIDRIAEQKKSGHPDRPACCTALQRLKKTCRICQAAGLSGTSLPLMECAGKTSLEYLYLYPPGIPLLVPGEVITDRLLSHIQEARQQGLELQGPKDYSISTLLVLTEKS